jgi:four helix bundle protein
MGITRFEDIDAWKAARKLADALFRVERASTSFKNRNLLNQMEKCADSGMANIVEGYDARSDREFLRFLKIAFRSISEFQSHLYVALDKQCIDRETFDKLYGQARETKALIGGFMRYLKKCLHQSKSKPE